MRENGGKQYVEDGVTKKELNGYIFVKIGRTFIPEHRLVVEEKIGRQLKKEEVVHHIDSNKKDNSIHND